MCTLPLNIEELPLNVNIEGCSLTVKMLSQEQGNISNNIISDFLKVSYQEILNTGNGLICFINPYTLGANKDFSCLTSTVDLLKVL